MKCHSRKSVRKPCLWWTSLNFHTKNHWVKKRIPKGHIYYCNSSLNFQSIKTTYDLYCFYFLADYLRKQQHGVGILHIRGAPVLRPSHGDLGSCQEPSGRFQTSGTIVVQVLCIYWLSFPGMGIPMLKIRRSRDDLVFKMGIPILVRRHLYIETAPWYHF